MYSSREASTPLWNVWNHFLQPSHCTQSSIHVVTFDSTFFNSIIFSCNFGRIIKFANFRQGDKLWYSFLSIKQYHNIPHSKVKQSFHNNSFSLSIINERNKPHRENAPSLTISKKNILTFIRLTAKKHIKLPRPWSYYISNKVTAWA